MTHTGDKSRNLTKDKAVAVEDGFQPEHYLEGGHGGVQAAYLLHRGRDQELPTEVLRAA